MRYVILIILLSALVNAVSIDSPTNNYFSNTNSLVLSCNTDGTGDLSLFGNFNSNFGTIETKQGVNGKISFNVNVNDGNYSWGCQFTSGNVSSFTENRTITVDTVKPAVEILSPSLEEVYGLEVILKYRITESNIDTCYYSINKGENSTSDCTGNITLNLEPKNNTIALFVKDKAGNFNYDEVSFIVLEPDRFSVSDIIIKQILNWENYSLLLTAETNYKAVCKYGFDVNDFDKMNLFVDTNNTEHKHVLYYDSNVDLDMFVKCQKDNDFVDNRTRVKFDFTPTQFSGGNLRTWDDVKVGRRLEYDLSDTLDSFESVEVKVGTAVEAVSVRIDEVKDKPGDLETPKNDVYKYFSIDWLNLDSVDIDDGTINFGVDKDWLEKRGASTHDIILLRFDDGWKELSTFYKKRYGTEYFFEAKTSGFSYFAVSLKGITQKPAEVSPITTSAVLESVQVNQETLGDKKPGSKLWMFGLLVIGVMFSFGFYIYLHRSDFGTQ